MNESKYFICYTNTYIISVAIYIFMTGCNLQLTVLNKNTLIYIPVNTFKLREKKLEHSKAS